MHRISTAIVFLILFIAPAVPAESFSDVRVPMVTPAGARLMLEGRLYDIPSGQRHSGIVLSHGSPRTAAQRRDPGYGNYRAQAEWFRSQGFVVLLVKRRGYGSSEGDFVEASGPCDTRDHVRDALTSANDIKAGIDYLRALPSVNPSRIVLVGQSAGGWGSLAQASRRPEGLIAVVNFAGGRGSIADGVNCNAAGLVESAKRFGRTSSVPSIWLYAANDRYIPPALSKQMFDAYAAATKADARYVPLPAFGPDGHATFGAAAAAGNWQPIVSGFLASLPK